MENDELKKSIKFNAYLVKMVFNQILSKIQSLSFLFCQKNRFFFWFPRASVVTQSRRASVAYLREQEHWHVIKNTDDAGASRMDSHASAWEPEKICRENSSRRVYRCASYTKNNKIVQKIGMVHDAIAYAPYK